MTGVPYLYIQRPDGSHIQPNIPDGARVAVHIPGRDCIELHADVNGCWSVKVGPELGRSGEFVEVASGRTLAFGEEVAS